MRGCEVRAARLKFRGWSGRTSKWYRECCSSDDVCCAFFPISLLTHYSYLSAASFFFHHGAERDTTQSSSDKACLAAALQPPHAAKSAGLAGRSQRRRKGTPLRFRVLQLHRLRRRRLAGRSNQASRHVRLPVGGVAASWRLPRNRKSCNLAAAIFWLWDPVCSEASSASDGSM